MFERRNYVVQAAHPSDNRVVRFDQLTLDEARVKADELHAAGYSLINTSTEEGASATASPRFFPG
jgi:hypothetical protein